MLFSVYTNNFTLFITYFLFFFILLLFDSIMKRTNIIYYYNCYVFGSLLLLLLNQLDNGTYFGSIDEILFFESATQPQEDWFIGNINFLGYYFLLNKFYLFIKNIVDIDIHFYHGILLNTFLSSFIPYFYHKYFSKNLNKIELRKVMIILLFIPQFLIFNSTYLRDSIITLLFAALFYIINKKIYSLKKKIIIITALILLSFFVRPASALFLLLFVFLDYYYYKINFKKSFLNFLIISLIIFSFYTFDSVFVNQLEVNQKYAELTLAESSSNSIGAALMKIDSIFLIPIKLLYILFSPVPPSIFFKINLYSMVFSIGSLVKYYYTILFLLTMTNYYLKKAYDRISSRDFFYILIILLLIGFTSTDPRHYNFLFPLIFYYGIKYSTDNPKIFKNVSISFLLLFPIVITIYWLLKFE